MANVDIQVFYYTGPLTRTPLPIAEALLARLNPMRRQRLLRVIETQRAQELAALRILEVAAQDCGLRSFRLADIEYPSVAGLSGKPRWTAGSMDFSLSHTRSIVACAIATQCRVGLDVEERRELEPKIVARVLHDSASIRGELSAGNAIERWTQIEAALKGAGLGITHAQEVHWRADALSLRGQSWWIEPLEIGADHIGHLASDVHGATVTVRHLQDLC